MSINVGIDFGSTYTAVSIYDKENNLVKALALEGDTPYIPSIVAKEERVRGKVFWGRTAKSKTGKRGIKVFKAFKMLLNERNPKILRDRGYDIIEELPSEEKLNCNSPEQITRIFLESLLKKAMDSVNADSIAHVVIGIPEIWNEVATYGGRKVLRDICCSFSFVENNNVQVISEPACASAFIAYKYLNQYDGEVLLVDYGGGTLDITLSSVTTRNGAMEIKVLEKKGVGENLEQKVGKAGIVYQETVVEKAILQVLEEVVYDDEFYSMVNDLETEIIGRKSEIEACFEEYGLKLERMKKDMEEMLKSDEDDESWRFTTLEYKGKDVDISYSLLLEVYEDVIHPILNRQLDLMQEYMISNGIAYEDGTSGRFKIAVVGGFGKYYPVRKQVEKKFGLSSRDMRRINMPESDSEQAISLGAALLAEGKVKLQRTSAFSFGILVQNKIMYAITYKQNIVPGKVNYVTDEEGTPCVFLVNKNEIKDYVLNFGADNRTATRVSLKDEIQKRMTNIRMNQYRTVQIGFSFDESEIMTMHIMQWDPMEQKVTEDIQYVLSRFDEMFDIALYNAIE